jgi:hypothetical protein
MQATMASPRGWWRSVLDVNPKPAPVLISSASDDFRLSDGQIIDHIAFAKMTVSIPRRFPTLVQNNIGHTPEAIRQDKSLASTL